MLQPSKQPKRNYLILNKLPLFWTILVNFKLLYQILILTKERKLPFFNRGLKDRIKDEIAHSGRPDNLSEVIDLSVRLDNRMFNRYLQKKSTNFPSACPQRSCKGP